MLHYQNRSQNRGSDQKLKNLKRETKKFVFKISNQFFLEKKKEYINTKEELC
jgi:hypothetical protein